MSLNPAFSSACACACAPDAKFSLNINAFNGNTTNFNRCPAPKSLPMPVQPRELPSTSHVGSSVRPYLVRPM